MLDRLRAEGVVFAPASGRQYATLSAMFERARDGMVFIAENGSYVVRDDEEVSSTLVDGATVAGIVAAMRANPRNIRYDDLAKVCQHYFGPPRTSGGSHAVFKTPWPGDPRVNIQDDHGQAKAYQVRQVLAAIEKKEGTT